MLLLWITVRLWIVVEYYYYEIVIEYYFLYFNEYLVLILSVYKICFRLKWNLSNNLYNLLFWKGKFDIQSDNASVLLQVPQVVIVRNETRAQVSLLTVTGTM